MLPIAVDPLLFRKVLLSWYKVHQRSLPWRRTKDPYKIWLSEIILQQTRVSQGLPYYERFITQYPSINALANATEQEILRLWQGLGYYSRARNLYHCAQTIVKQYDGVFPTNYQTLLSLKGIGPYTAAAIAAISFKEVVAAVDGNVYRVLARIFGLFYDIGTPQGRKQIIELATTLVDPCYPDHYSQAIMDFGALQCTPALPLCTTCTFQPYCNAFHTNAQQSLPVKTSKIGKKKRYFNYVLIQYRDAIYMKKRIERDIWHGMYDFYLIENRQRLALNQMQDPLLTLASKHHIATISYKQEIRHVLTHQVLSIQFHTIEATLDFLQESVTLFHTIALKPFSREAIEALPKPIVIQKILQKPDLVSL